MSIMRRQKSAEIERIFYCIGAQKAGTTWLYSQLQSHPDVHFGPRKEVHYWDSIGFPYLPYYRAKADAEEAELRKLSWRERRRRFGTRGYFRQLAEARRYRRLFQEADPDHSAYRAYLSAGRTDEALIGDMSPGYAMMRAESFAAMNAFAPDARFLFIMRDPFERLWSNIRHDRKRNFLPDGPEGNLDAALNRAVMDAGSGAFVRTDYVHTICQIEAAVPRERIGYFFYETMFGDEELARLSVFLGIAPIRVDVSQRVNAGVDLDVSPDPEVEARARMKLAPIYEFAAQRFGARLPDAWMAGIA